MTLIKIMAVTAVAMLTVALANNPAEARKVKHTKASAVTQVMTPTERMEFYSHGGRATVPIGRRGRAATYDANGNGVVIGGRPVGCPRLFCGCEASRYVFGQMRPELYLAANWIRKFPRTAPASGMAAARSGHVMVLISHAGGSDWLVHDGNSGGGLTRRHVRSIAGYVVVNPHGSRVASR